nr:aminotransferase class I/II-fold pyridoxal phosphate-dependent enzyme [Tsukamurella pulmonis]
MVSTESHIVPVLVGDAHKCKQLADILLHEYAEYAQPINFPSVPRGTERLRIIPSPVHRPAAVRRFVDLVDDAWTRLELPRTPEIGAGAPRLNEERHQAVLG